MGTEAWMVSAKEKPLQVRQNRHGAKLLLWADSKHMGHDIKNTQTSRDTFKH